MLVRELWTLLSQVILPMAIWMGMDLELGGTMHLQIHLTTPPVFSLLSHLHGNFQPEISY